METVIGGHPFNSNCSLVSFIVSIHFFPFFQNVTIVNVFLLFQGLLGHKLSFKYPKETVDLTTKYSSAYVTMDEE
jgi:hypothetical protein